MAQTRFNFIGTVMLPKTDSKRPLVKDIEKNGLKMKSLNFGIKESDHNMAFVEMFGIKSKTIKTMDKDNNKIEIDWSDRLDENVISSVASYRQHTVNLGEDFGGNKTFITEYDAIEYLAENLSDFKGKLCITGQMKKEYYKGKYYDKFVISNVYAVDEDKKSRLQIVSDIYYNKDSVDTDDWKSEKKIYIDGYVEQYINKDEGIKFIPQRFVFNASKYDENNEKHQKLLDYKLKYVKNTSKKMQHLQWECVLLNGSEAVEFDESQLTKSQREQIDLGIKTIDDFKPVGSIYGERINEYRLFDPKLIGAFDNGFVDADYTAKEFEDMIYSPAADEDIKKVVAKAESKAVDDDDDTDEDDLF